ncbi:MAG: hypothetical protein ACRD50_13975 [Candidatus Acidiferrales bacterium]
MSSSPDPKANAGGDAEVKEGANVDKIRDILFGSQMRDYEKRFGRLEDRLNKDAEALREDLKKRFDTLEAFIHKELESINTRLKSEKSERGEALKEVSRELREASKLIEKRVAQLDDVLTDNTAELRARILEQSKALTAEIGEHHREVSVALDREVKTLREEKTDREALADLLTEMALRLKNEFELPAK